jgi:regulator of protease activity HflC (stomatin/prohibitin superfamily)
MGQLPIGLTLVILFGLYILITAIRILKEYERAVIFRLGRFTGVKGPGLIFLIPLVDKMVKVSFEQVALDYSQDVITQDTSIKVNAVVYFRVLHPERAFIQVENYLQATSQISRQHFAVLQQSELDEIPCGRNQPAIATDHRRAYGAMGH